MLYLTKEGGWFCICLWPLWQLHIAYSWFCQKVFETVIMGKGWIVYLMWELGCVHSSL